MSKEYFLINEMFGEAWECAIRNTINAVGEIFELKASDWTKVEKLAENLKIRFDANGDII